MEKIQNEKKFILNENLWRVMIKLSLPAVIAMVLYGLNTVFDAIFIGKFVGETALAGVSLAYPLTQLTLGIGSLIGVGAGSALSIAIGEGDRESQKKILSSANYLILITSLVFMAISYIFTDQLIAIMGGSGAALEIGASYFRVTLIGTLVWVGGIASNMIIRAEGKMKKAAWIMGLGLVVNIVFNYIFIVGFNFGVVGAAWGTNIGMLIYTILGYRYFNSGKTSFEAKSFSIRRDGVCIKKILSMGIPSLIMTIMSVIQAVVVLNIISKIGTEADIAFYGATYRIFTFLLTPIFGLMRAMQPVVGINYGANQNERVISSFKIFAIGSAILMMPFWIVAMGAPQVILSWMLPEKSFLQAELINFRIFMALLPAMPIMFMGMTFFPAIDKGKIASVFGITRQILFYIPVMLIMPIYFGLHWVYYGAFFIDAALTILILVLVMKEFRNLRKSNHKLLEKIS